MSTLAVPPFLTNPRQDAIDLYKAFKGFGCDSAAVINILAHRDATQRALIQQEYKAMYSAELTNRLSSELSGNLKKAMLLWILDPAGRDATVLREALCGVIDLYAATEIICSRTPSQIQTIKQIYHAKFGVHLEHDIRYQASGDHQKLLLAYIGTGRYEGHEVDPHKASKDAKDLFKAGERRLGTDEKTFIHIFSERSRAQLAAVASYYDHTYGNKLEKAVKGETSGLFEFALLTILRCAENPAKYFAKVLRKAMKGLGTNDTALVRVVVTRTEIDMQYIKVEYHKKYKKHLHDAIHSETSGHYRTFLLSLVGSHA
ncbi:annexin D5-like [Zingiber officinale]|uniref:annexin D5-like n=1 Tax=Zingiber officinale TaxID=94328 RepID=UPI001C4A9B50|nr:annexin D5-like [Zingiber officinale]